eukprot:TRINITY_DN6121_c0_g1_i1.p1 TRINITY_DN6121_c0_g1~~TRINITY_DN6121_c0_g1_i1.p1  ORF type:complete len:134 (+),score=22.76 TRINITY_DN6121_c0_g1_i1:46-402(+)
MARFLAQFLVVGAQVLTRAMIDAMRLARQRAAQNGTASDVVHKAGLFKEMGVDEARNILSVNKTAGLPDVLKKHEQLYAANDPKEGGSEYLAQKINRAREVLEAHIRNPPPPPPSSNR